MLHLTQIREHMKESVCRAILPFPDTIKIDKKSRHYNWPTMDTNYRWKYHSLDGSRLSEHSRTSNFMPFFFLRKGCSDRVACKARLHLFAEWSCQPIVGLPFSKMALNLRHLLSSLAGLGTIGGYSAYLNDTVTSGYWDIKKGSRDSSGHGRSIALCDKPSNKGDWNKHVGAKVS